MNTNRDHTARTARTLRGLHANHRETCCGTTPGAPDGTRSEPPLAPRLHRNTQPEIGTRRHHAYPHHRHRSHTGRRRGHWVQHGADSNDTDAGGDGNELGHGMAGRDTLTGDAGDDSSIRMGRCGHADGKRWVMAYEYDGANWRVTMARRIEVGQPVEVGRLSEMPLGVLVPNTLVSRSAMWLSPTEHGWDIKVTNRNSAILRPWCLPPQRTMPHECLIDWPLVAVQMLPASKSLQHWVLLEFDDPSLLPDVARREPFSEMDERHGPPTATRAIPGRLTGAEHEALRTVFQAQLRWPPTGRSEPMLLKQAAARLGISISGIQDRLKSALARALALGLDRTVPLTDPSYLYILARAGYLDLPTHFPHRPPRDLSA